MKGSIYIFEEDIGFYKYYKIGLSRDVVSRQKDLQRKSCGKLVLVFVQEYSCLEDASEVELMIHIKLKQYHLPNRGKEWYKIDLSHILKVIDEISPKEFHHPAPVVYKPNAFYQIVNAGLGLYE